MQSKRRFLNPSSFRRYAQRLCNYANVPIINSLLHSSRHYFSTQCQENGISADDTGKALGQTNIKVSKVCLGCMSFGKAGTMHDWTLDEKQTEEMVKHALDLGINFFDTANTYSNGTSEE